MENNTNEKVFCVNCGAEVEATNCFCPKCGYAIQEKTIEKIEEIKEVKNENLIEKIKRWITENKKNKIIACVVTVGLGLIILLSIIMPILTNSNPELSLSGDDLAAYNLIYEASYEFKNPSSVRVLSGSVIYDEEEKEWSGWFALSATNGFGARTTGYYFVSYLDNEIFALDLEEVGSSSISFAKKMEIDIDKINYALEKKWESFN